MLIILLSVCLSGCGGGSDNEAFVVTEENYVNSVYGYFNSSYFDPSLVRAPVSGDTVKAYVNGYRNAGTDIYSTYFGYQSLQNIQQHLSTAETATVRLYNPGILYVSFDKFVSGTADRLIVQIEGYIQTGGLNALVIDLRANTGGSPLEAARFLEYLSGSQPDGTMLYKTIYGNGIELTWSKGGISSTYASENRFDSTNTYVLTSGLTGSAAEIVVAGLVTFNEAVQAGSTTFGKNRLVQFVEIERGDGFEITVARVTHADGVDREGTGLIPTAITDDPFAYVMNSLGGGTVSDPLQTDMNLSDSAMEFLHEMAYWRGVVLNADYSNKPYYIQERVKSKRLITHDSPLFFHLLCFSPSDIM